MAFVYFLTSTNIWIKLTFTFLIVLILLCFTIKLTNCDDYYQLLGVKKTADNRAIRKAFKKLALLQHPDKNQVCF